MRKTSLGTLLALPVLLLFAATLRADVYKDPLSGITFPDAFGDFERGEVKSYEYEPGKKGVAIGYTHDTTAITIFVRAIRASQASLTSADYLDETAAQIKDLEKNGSYADVKFSELPAPAERPGWSTGIISGVFKGTPVDSFAACKVIPGYLVKIRATADKGRGGDLLAALTDIKENLDRQTPASISASVPTSARTSTPDSAWPN